VTTGGAKPRARSAGDGVAIELSIECRDAPIAEALNQVLMPDNRYFPKDQRFRSSMKGSIIRFDVASPRARPVVSTVASIISDARLFSDIWRMAKTKGSGAPRKRPREPARVQR
jgi:hypothetical protein